MNAAIRVETLKLVRSPVGTIGTLALTLGTIALLGGITAALAGGNPELTAKIGKAATLDWDGLLDSAVQITAAGGLLGYGVVLSWLFGREFADGTVDGLFALPVSRGRIALAKFAVYAAWATGTGLVLAIGVLVLGLLLGYGIPDAGASAALLRQLALAVLTAAIATPTALVATLTRSLLAGVGSAIALVVTAQIGALAGGAWVPLAAPALWAMSGGSAVDAVQLALPVVFGLIAVALTCAAWTRLQLDR